MTGVQWLGVWLLVCVAVVGLYVVVRAGLAARGRSRRASLDADLAFLARDIASELVFGGHLVREIAELLDESAIANTAKQGLRVEARESPISLVVARPGTHKNSRRS